MHRLIVYSASVVLRKQGDELRYQEAIRSEWHKTAQSGLLDSSGHVMRKQKTWYLD